MAKLLGGRFCIESLHTDVTDLQEAVMDVFSRSGPVQATSWKYPDKISADLDITDLLENYGYSDDEEERQVSHIVLLELVIDRLVLLLQAMSRYIEQMSFASGAIPTQGSPGSITGVSKHTAVGLVVKRYWACMVQAFAHMCSLQRETKSKSREIMDLKEQVRNLETQLETMKQKTAHVNTTLADFPIPLNDHDSRATGAMSQASTASTISRDEYNKACQTIETAFVPCESCLFVQQNFRESGKVFVNLCKTQGLPSSLEKCMSQFAGVEWMAGNDVKRWNSEQNKDVNRLNKHLEYLMSTIDPLKADLAAETNKNKKMKARVEQCEKEVKLEKETQSTQRRQYESKIRDLERDKIERLGVAKNEINSLENEMVELSMRLKHAKDELESQQEKYQELAEAKSALETGMDKRVASSDTVLSLKAQVEDLQSKWKSVTEKLTEADRELSLEKAKLKSINKHSESMQSKQASLLERLSELDLQNDDLRNQASNMEDEKDALQEALEVAQNKQRESEQGMEEQKALVGELEREKQGLEDAMDDLRQEVTAVEEKLRATQEELRLLVEYPDLNGPVNPDYTGTGDLTHDMENQVKANAARIQLLEEQNAQLTRSITKLMQTQKPAATKRWQASNAHEMTQPVPLWRPRDATSDTNVINKARMDDQTRLEEEELRTDSPPHHTKTGTHNGKRRAFEEVRSQDKVETSRQETFVVGKATHENKTRARPASGHKGSQKTESKSHSASSVGAYSRLKAAGMIHKESRPRSGKQPPDDNYQMPDVFTCHKCDKVYNSRRDLEVHNSYCYGGL